MEQRSALTSLRFAIIDSRGSRGYVRDGAASHLIRGFFCPFAGPTRTCSRGQAKDGLGLFVGLAILEGQGIPEFRRFEWFWRGSGGTGAPVRRIVALPQQTTSLAAAFQDPSVVIWPSPQKQLLHNPSAAKAHDGGFSCFLPGAGF